MDMRSEATGAVRLSGALTIRRVAELRDVLMTSLASHQDIILDLDSEAEADISFVQLVLATEVSARSSGKHIRLKNACAGPLREVLERGGFLAADKAGFWTGEGVAQ